MFRITVSLFLLFICSFCIGQTYEAMQKQTESSWSTAFGLHALDNEFIVGGIAYFDSLDYQHMFMSVFDYNGDLLHFDTIPQLDYFLVLGRSNNMILKGDLLYWMSVGSGRTMIYSYDWKGNDFIALDTFETYLSDFDTYDFLLLGENEYLLSGAYITDNTEIDLGIIHILNDSIVNSYRRVDFKGNEIADRILLNNDNTYTLIARINEEDNKDSRIYKFDKDLNLLESNDEGSELFKVHFSQQITDSEGCLVYSSLKGDLNKREYRPIITKLDRGGNLIWERIIGRYEQGFTLFSKWNGIVESNQKDGYIISGSAYIDAPERDTMLSYGVVAKLSTDGDSIWYRNFTSLDSSHALHYFQDIISIPTGGYIAAGYDQYIINIPEGEPRYNIIMVRLDEDGFPMINTSTNSVIIDEGIDVKLYPNPCIDQVFISSKDTGLLNCKIVDSTGNVVNSFVINNTSTFILNTNDLPKGLYYLVCDNKRNRTSKKLIVVK